MPGRSITRPVQYPEAVPGVEAGRRPAHDTTRFEVVPSVPGRGDPRAEGLLPTGSRGREPPCGARPGRATCFPRSGRVSGAESRAAAWVRFAIAQSGEG